MVFSMAGHAVLTALKSRMLLSRVLLNRGILTVYHPVPQDQPIPARQLGAVYKAVCTVVGLGRASINVWTLALILPAYHYY